MSAPELIDRLRVACADVPAEIGAVYLFGSRARGDHRPESDLDIAVLGKDRVRLPTAAALDDLSDRLELVARRGIDLVVLDTAPPDLIHRVLRDGVILLDRDRSRRIAFEVQARNEYFDLESVRRQYRHTARPLR